MNDDGQLRRATLSATATAETQQATGTQAASPYAQSLVNKSTPPGSPNAWLRTLSGLGYKRSISKAHTIVMASISIGAGLMTRVSIISSMYCTVPHEGAHRQHGLNEKHFYFNTTIVFRPCKDNHFLTCLRSSVKGQRSSLSSRPSFLHVTLFVRADLLT